MLQVSRNTLQQVEKLKYLGLVFTSNGRWNEEIDTWIGKSHAELLTPLLSLEEKQA